MARLALGGDVMLARGLGRQLAAGEGPALVGESLRSVFQDADLAVANLECCIVAPAAAPAGVAGRNHRGAVRFCAPPQAADAVARLGLGCVSLANNHAADAGALGLRETADRLADVGVAAIGITSGHGPAQPRPGRAGPGAAGPGSSVVFEVAGVRIGVLAVHDSEMPLPWAAEDPDGRGAAIPASVDLGSGCPESLRRDVQWLPAVVRHQPPNRHRLQETRMTDLNLLAVSAPVDTGLDLRPSIGGDFDLDVTIVPVGETPTSRRIVDSGTYTCSTQSCCASNACH